MVENLFWPLVATVLAAVGLFLFRNLVSRMSQAALRRSIQVVEAAVVVAVHHSVSVNLAFKNDLDSLVRIRSVVVEFAQGDKRPAKVSASMSKVEPGSNSVIVEWKRTDRDQRVSSLRFDVDGHWLESPPSVLDKINLEISKRPRQ